TSPMVGSFAGCCARAASGHAVAPPKSATNCRRPMPDMGGPSLRDCRILSLPPTPCQVLGVGLNRSESNVPLTQTRMAAHACTGTLFYVFMPAQRGAF